MSLYMKDSTGKRVKIAGTGVDGKSAYQSALDAGYTGSEADFNKTLKDVPEHIANKENPHGVTAAQVGAAPASHNHSATNITSGTLPVSRGGTGQTTLTPPVGTSALRAIYAGTTDMAAGSTALTTGAIYLCYQ